MPLILSIETGTEVCSVALARDGVLIALRESGGDQAGRGQHAHRLGIYIEEVLREHDLDAKDLDAVAVGAGPGSYTGLRIGVSTAKGICYALNKPLLAIDSLKALACAAMEEIEAGLVEMNNPETTVLAPMIDARRMEVYTRQFDTALRPLTPTVAEVITSESFAELRGGELLIFGNGAAKVAELLPWARLIRIASSARGMVPLAEVALAGGDYLQDGAGRVDMAYFEPLYLKDFVVTKSRKTDALLSR